MKLVVQLYVCTFFMLYLAAHESCDNLKLELVQVLFRHGARTPVKEGLELFNVTDYSVYEPWGFEELTKEGKRQEHNFGKFLRKRYTNYLNSTYKSKDIYGYSGDTSRAKMSLQLVLAGLYPPDRFTKWDPFLDWSPIPYSYAPKRLDILLSAYTNPKFVLLMIKSVLSKEFTTKLTKYSELFDLVGEKTNGKKTAVHALAAFDVLISNEYMNLPLPDWYTSKVRQTFIEMMELIWDATTATKKMKKLAIGSLIKTFVENMNLDEVIDNPRKIYLYSGHDLNIAMFTRSHGIKEFRYPFFGSALIFEKLRDSKNQIYVRLFAWDGIDKLQDLEFGNGMKCCPIEDYLEIVKPVIPSEKEIDHMIGRLSGTELKDLFFDNAYEPTDSIKSLFDLSNIRNPFIKAFIRQILKFIEKILNINKL